MKKLVFLVLCLNVTFAMLAQVDTTKNFLPVNTFGNQFKNLKMDSSAIFPLDTFKLKSNWRGIAFKGALPYYWDGTKYQPFAAGGAGVGTVTSVGVTMPAAFNVSGSPITGSGIITITGAGSTPQYIRGNGTLATLSTDVQAIGDARYSLLAHTHVFANITDGTTAVRNLFSAGTGLSYNSSTGVFSATGSTSVNWGDIIGDINDQTDLITILNDKVNKADSSNDGGYYPYSTNPKNYLVAADLSGYVPTSRTITINGTAFDLSANRTWNVGTLVWSDTTSILATQYDLSQIVSGRFGLEDNSLGEDRDVNGHGLYHLSIDSLSYGIIGFDINNGFSVYDYTTNATLIESNAVSGTRIFSQDALNYVQAKDDKIWFNINDASDSLGSTVLPYNSSARVVAMAQDSVTGKWYRQTASGGGGSQTLQQVFDVETGEALINKDDTINVSTFTLKTFGTGNILNQLTGAGSTIHNRVLQGTKDNRVDVDQNAVNLNSINSTTTSAISLYADGNSFQGQASIGAYRNVNGSTFSEIAFGTSNSLWRDVRNSNTVKIELDSTGIYVNAGSGRKFSVFSLPNLSTQDRLIGQASGTSQTGYVTIGSGLSLSSGTLTASGVLTESDPLSIHLTGTSVLTGNVIVTQAANTVTWNGSTTGTQFLSANSSTGTALKGTTTGGGTGVWGETSGNGWGGFFKSATGNGIETDGGTGAGIYSHTSTGIVFSGINTGNRTANLPVFAIEGNWASTNSNEKIATFTRTSSGAVADGISGSIDMLIENSSAATLTNRITSRLTTVNLGTRMSEMDIDGFNAGTQEVFLRLQHRYILANNLTDTVAYLSDVRAGGGGGTTDLTFTGSGPYTLNSSTGTDVTITQGNNILITRSSNDLSFAAVTPTLQQVFDVETGEALVNKNDTINNAAHRFYIRSTTAGANDGLYIYQYDGSTSFGTLTVNPAYFATEADAGSRVNQISATAALSGPSGILLHTLDNAGRTKALDLKLYPDSLYIHPNTTDHFNFIVIGLPNKSVVGTDSALIQDASGKIWKTPTSSFGGSTTLTSVGGGLDIQSGGAGNIRTLNTGEFANASNLISINAIAQSKITGLSDSLLNKANINGSNAYGQWSIYSKGSNHKYVVAASDAPTVVKNRADYICDGTNDESEINTALSLGDVVLTTGTFNISASIPMPSNRSMEGSGDGTVLKGVGFTTTSKMITNSGTTNIALRNFTIDGNASDTTGYGIYFEEVGTGWSATSTNGALVENIYFKDIWQSGVELASCRHSKISNTRATGVHYDAIVLRKIIGRPKGCVNVSITGNHSQNSLAAIWIRESEYVTVSNNMIEGDSTLSTSGQIGIQIESNTRHLIISNNVVADNRDNNIYVSSGDNVVINGNIVRNSLFQGIYITGADSSIISNNEVSLNGQEGIYGDAPHLLISNNLVYTNSQTTNDTYSGIVNYDHHGIITGNKVSRGNRTNKQKYGILTNAGATDVMIEGNYLYQAGNTGDMSINSSARVRNNVANDGTWKDLLYTDYQMEMNTDKLLGRSTAAQGKAEEITIGSGLSLSAGTLSATGGSAALTSTYIGFGDGSNVLTGSSTLVYDLANLLVNQTGGGQTMTQTGYGGLYFNPNTNSAQLTIENAGGVEGGFFTHVSGKMYFGTYSNHPLYFEQNNADVGIINTSGEWQIGSATDQGDFITQFKGGIYRDITSKTWSVQGTVYNSSAAIVALGIDTTTGLIYRKTASGGSGEINTASNLGGGLANYSTKVGVDLQFNSFSSSYFSLSSNVISIASSIALGGNPTTTTQSQNNNSTRIATTAYTDLAVSNAIAGVNPAEAVEAATTANVTGYTYNNGVGGVGATLTQNVASAVTIDGYTLLLNDRVLFKNQTASPSGSTNGVYVITTLGTGVIPAVFTRATDYNQPSDINNTGTIPVINGTVNATTSWLLTTQVTTMGTDPLTYVQFSYAPSSLLTTSNIGVTVQGWDADLDTWKTITPGSGVATFLATPSSANFFSAITDETGSGKAVGATNPVLVGPTIGISGTAASSHITTVGSVPTVSQTGAGSGGSLGIALETGSTDQAGVITITTGNASVGSTGTITLTFNGAYVTNQPSIVLTLVKGATDWGALATIRVTTQSLTAPIFTWNNSATGAAVALTANTTYKVAYMVIQK